MKKLLLVLLTIVFATNCNSQPVDTEPDVTPKQDVIKNFDTTQTAQWRGPERDGKYPSTGLLKKWPAKGPKLIWHYDKLGEGHASAAVTSNFVYTTGTDMEAGTGFIIAFNHNGTTAWKKTYAKEWLESWDGVRSTPLIDGENLYIMSSYGVLVCMSAKTGEKKWTVNLFKDYDGENIKWGVTENLVLDGDKLFCIPGGKQANVLALNKHTGELIWKCAGKGELSAYHSPLVINHNGRKIFVGQTASSILGIDVETGKLLWSHNQPNKWSVHANTPLYSESKLFCVSGYGKGNVMLEISEDGNSIKELWRNENLDSKMGGVVLHNGIIYGSGDKNRAWFALDWNTGKLLSENDEFTKGNIIFADGMLYCYDQKGKVALAEPLKDGYKFISSFDVPFGEKQHWAHLVIHNKRLYIRHGTSLMVYDIAE